MTFLSEIYSLMLEGIAVHEFVYDDSGKPIDYLITDFEGKIAAILP